MYAITVDRAMPNGDLPSLFLMLISALRLETLDVLGSEMDELEWPYKKLAMPQDADVLYNGLRLLRDDLGFFTLSCKNRALIIPFEGDQFNIVISDQENIPVIDGLTLADATDVLLQYRDAYDAYGLKTTFPK